MNNKSGITKRLFNALNSLIGDKTTIDVEEAIFQLGSVIESTAKIKYSNIKNSKSRFLEYIEDSQLDLLFIWSNGSKIYFDGFWDTDKEKRISIGELLYQIRCSNYHDPEELEHYLTIDTSQGGSIGLNKIDIKLTISLFLILVTDEINIERIHKEVFENFGKFIIGNKSVNIYDLIGKRDKLFETIKKLSTTTYNKS